MSNIDMTQCDFCGHKTSDRYDPGWIRFEGLDLISVSKGRRPDRIAETNSKKTNKVLDFCTQSCLINFIEDLSRLAKHSNLKCPDSECSASETECKECIAENARAKAIQSTNKKIDLIYSVLSNIDKEFSRLNHGPSSFYFNKLKTYLEGLFSFAKFKVGDMVKLRKTHKFDHGWRLNNPTFKKDALAEIIDIEFDENGFIYNIVFNNELWEDSKGKIRYTADSDKHYYGFREADLIKV